jgi:uncharacterized protein
MEDLKAKVDRYLDRAKPLYAGLRVNPSLACGCDDKALKMLDTSMRYYSDAQHFYKKGEYLNALTALEYSEGWMDAGLEIGLLVRKQ